MQTPAFFRRFDMKYVYPAIFEDDDGKIGVTVPDIPHCYTFGDNMADAIEMAKDYIMPSVKNSASHGKSHDLFS